MYILCKTGVIPAAEAIIELYKNYGLPRPLHDPERISKMYQHSNLVITAWEKELPVGVSRSITDWAWSFYIADLAVREGYKKSGIGKKIEFTKAAVGEQSMVLLLSVPTATEYYPKLGSVKQESSFIMNREL